MRIEVANPKPPFKRPLFDSEATIEVGGLVYDVGLTSRADLREDALAFASGLQARVPFKPEFGYEPMFNVDFDGDQFVTYIYRPRLKSLWQWWPMQWWLGSIKVMSRPESVSAAIAYLKQFAASLESP